MNSPESALIYLLLVVGISVVIFLVLRTLMLWYWRVNDIIAGQEKIAHNQEQQIILLKAMVRHQIGEEEYGKLFQSTNHLKPTEEQLRKAKAYDSSK